MAEEKKAEGNEEKNAKKKKKGSPLKLIIFILLPLIILGGGGYFAYVKFFSSSPESKKKGVIKKEVKKEEAGHIYSLKTFVVNLAGERRYLKTTISLELDSEKAVEEVEKKLPRIRDNILMILGNESFKTISTLQGKDNLRKRIAGKLNSFLAGGKIRNVYFTEFIIQ